MSLPLALLSNRQGLFPSATGIAPAVVNSITVSLASPTINVGQTVQAIATPRDINGVALNGRLVTWSSLSPSVASVDPSSGLVSGVSVNTAIIRATCEGVTGDVTLNVVAGESIVGCITFSDWSPGNTADSDSQINILLGNPSLYLNRLPYYANPSVPSMDEGLQSIIDTDIQAAHAAGIKFWTFQPFSVKNRYALNYYLASAYKPLLKFCLMQFKLLPPTSQYITDGLTLINDPQYLTFGGRPVFFFETWLLQGLSTPTEIANYRQSIIDSGHLNPFFIGMNLGAPATIADMSTWSFDACSQYSGGSKDLPLGLNPYATQVSLEEGEWNAFKASGYQQVPSVTVGYDDRWAGANHYTADATPTEIANHLRNAINFAKNNPSAVRSNIILISALNEFVEGHAIEPYNTSVNAIGSGRMDAISAVLNNVVTAPTVNSVTVSLSAVNINAGQTSQASATPRDISGNVLTGRVITYSTGNNAIATVSPSGVVTAVAIGSTSIIATCEGIQGTAQINVIPQLVLGDFTNPTYIKSLAPEIDIIKPGASVLMSFRFNPDKTPDIGHSLVRYIGDFAIDASAPTSPPNIGSFTVGIGAIGGGISDSTFPVDYNLPDDGTENGLPHHHEIIVTKVIKVKSPYQWPGSNSHKVWALYESDGSMAGWHWLMLNNIDPGSTAGISPANGQFTAFVLNESGGEPTTNYYAGLTGQYTPMNYDIWHRLTLYIKQSSTFGAKDGIYKLYVSSYINGQWTTPALNVNVTNVPTRGAQTNFFSTLSDCWMWGGGGVAVIASTVCTDHLIISV